jgi:hypothetical protein
MYAAMQDGTSPTAGELRSHAQMSQANTQLFTPEAADGSSGSSALPTLQQGVVAQLVDALWPDMHSVGLPCSWHGRRDAVLLLVP